ncbi:MAG: B3/4 domain-containing protein [Ktedonobacterales bacterium]
MEFVVAPDVFARFPGLRVVVAVAAGLDNAVPRPVIEREWRAAWEAAAVAAAPYGNAQSHPRVAPWRERFTAMGVSGKQFPSSIEALLRRALKGGEPFRINPLVDWYNAISLRHTVPAGAFDLAAIAGPLELRVTRASDMFTALDSAEPEAIPPGELAYADGAAILTRHFVWRQAKTGLVSATTRDLILLSEVLGAVGQTVADAVLADFLDGLRAHFGIAGTGAVVSAEQPVFRW